MIIYDLINLKKIRRAALYGACLIVLLLIQETVLSRIRPLGVGAMPMPALICAVGLFEGGLGGGVFGIFAGLLCDMAGSGTTVLLTVTLAVVGFLSGLLCEVLINRRFYSYMIIAALMLLLTALCQALPVWIYHGAAILPLLRTAALQAAWSVPFAVPSYFACRAIAGRRFRE